LYDAVLGFPLRSVRRKIAWVVASEGLFPCLDVCCGTGSELRLLRKSGEPQEDSRFAVGLDKSFGMVRYAAALAAPLPFINGDAFRLPLKDGLFKSIIISFALHDKPPEGRAAMASEAMRVLAPGGLLILADFERPWDAASRRGAVLTGLVEWLAREPHYGNGREFLRRGGLRGFLAEHGFVERRRRDVAAASFSIVAAVPSSPRDLGRGR
jgi:demethylmenaquinone methyltransferase/2-methoxy-6-polyprenyl-1,4-benzoquinol methylase